MKSVDWIKRFIGRPEKYKEQRQLILFLRLLIDALSGLAAVLLKNLVYFTRSFLFSQLKIESVSLLYLGLPLIGIFLTVLFVKYFVNENISNGITKILSFI